MNQTKKTVVQHAEGIIIAYILLLYIPYGLIELFTYIIHSMAR